MIIESNKKYIILKKINKKEVVLESNHWKEVLDFVIDGSDGILLYSNHDKNPNYLKNTFKFFQDGFLLTKPMRG